MTNFCPNCGTKMEAMWRACPKCGTKVDDDEKPQAYSMRQSLYSQPQRPSYQPMQQRPSYQSSSPYPQNMNNTFGIASLIISIVGCCCLFFLAPVFGIIAIVLGGMGFKRDYNNTLSVIGIVIGIIDILFGIFYLFLLFTVFLYY